MTPYTPQIICIDCDATAAIWDWRCPECGGPLDIANPQPFDADRIDAGTWSLWRYGAMLPTDKRFSLGEGMTPLVQTSVDGLDFYAKLEYLNPTGSYKDRGTTVLVNRLLGENVRDVVEDSSGNAGASLAAYAGPSGIHARIFVSTTASAAKKRLIATNAELVEVSGVRSAATAACHAAAETTVYASHAWSPFFLAGQMTAAYEVWEQLGHRAPDAILTPVGHGGLFLGFARGFAALHEAGLVERLPRMIATQAAGCDPIVQGYEQQLNAPPVTQEEETIADGIIVNQPVRGREILRVIRETDGAAYRVQDAAIIAAQKMLAERGLFVEATSAVPLAALREYRHDFAADTTIIMPLTGSGLKGLPGK